MSKKNGIKAEITKTDRVIDVMSTVLLFILWIVVLFFYNKLPDIIPIHYNASGEADGFGSKLNIFVLLAIPTSIFVVLTILIKYPRILGYSKDTEEKGFNKKYTNAMLIVRYAKLGVVAFSGIICIDIINSSLTQSASKLEAWSAFLVFVIVICLFVDFFIRSR